jgi:diguanylate cyclase (GGDEF)-like protein
MDENRTDEERRLAVLRRFDVLDVVADQAQRDLALLASLVTGAPVALTVLVDESRAWPLTAHGCRPTETSRSGTVADEVVLTGRPVVLLDPLEDERFRDDGLLRVLRGRHVVGVPLLASDQVVGALIVAEPQPLAASASIDQVAALELVAGRVVADLELRRTRVELALELGARNLQRRTDELTGLHDRRGLFERASVEFARHRRHGTGVLVAAIDLDGFSRFNARNGTPAGDLLLQRTARSLEDAGRRADLLGRWAGDRFVLVAPDTPSEGVAPLLERVRATIAGLVVEGDGVTCSIGAAVAGPGRDEFSHALQAAEQELARVRDTGRDAAGVAPVPAAVGA